MKLHAINHDLTTQLWCGLAAMATITGKPTSECRDMISAIRRNRRWLEPEARVAIKGIEPAELRLALEKSGFTATRLSVSDKPTLARYLREREKSEMAELLLIVCGRHYVVVKGRKLIDSHTQVPVWIRQAPHRRKRVGSVVAIRSAIDKAQGR
jgi:hypothetical protein